MQVVKNSHSSQHAVVQLVAHFRLGRFMGRVGVRGNGAADCTSTPSRVTTNDRPSWSPVARARQAKARRCLPTRFKIRRRRFITIAQSILHRSGRRPPQTPAPSLQFCWLSRRNPVCLCPAVCICERIETKLVLPGVGRGAGGNAVRLRACGHQPRPAGAG